jgi:VIT1/CCC1 family predicted Fe2+/Mn2+ transporter
MGIMSRIDKARDAFRKGDITAAKKAHDIDAIKGEHHMKSGQYIKSAVYGGLDGTITTFAVVAGVAGASLHAGVVLILGFANLIGDGISMAIGDYLSTKSEQEYHKAERKRESWEVDNFPESEKQEMIQIYKNKGYAEKEAMQMVKIMAKKKESFVDVMMVEELGILENDENPMKNALITFFSFAMFGLVPLVAYLISLLFNVKMDDFLIASILTGLTLFVLGALKTRVTGKNWFNSGLEMLLVGGIAASAAYLIGYLLSGLA